LNKIPIAKFKITDSFKITGRGIVLAGTILEGVIHTGDSIEFFAKNRLLRRLITGVEGITKSPPDDVNIGLIIKCENDLEMDELANWLPQTTIGYIYIA
jgi:translation elongation factor EF-Tu-like GTPase